MSEQDPNVILGYISGVYGLRGWVKVHSHTDPREAILNYQPWLLGTERKPVQVESGRRHGKTVVAKLPGVDTPEQARILMQQVIEVPRQQLPEAGGNSWYWSDLIGLTVVNQDQVKLGSVRQMIETGANDVMVLQGTRERLVPFVLGHTVQQVDLAAGVIEVNWHEDD